MYKYSFYFILLCLVTVKAYYYRTDNNQYDRDLPEKRDLDVYLKPIENLTNHFKKNISDININYMLGIFLTNVHLDRVLLKKCDNLPYDLQTRIKEIVDTNKQTLEYFRSKSRHDARFLFKELAIISHLFDNSQYWINHVKNFHYETEPNYSRYFLEQTYSVWEKYAASVDDVMIYQPNPENSDKCLVTLSINPKNHNSSVSSWCPVANMCYNIVEHGTDFGYALCHRLFLLIAAKLGRGCFILSVDEDAKLKRKFCRMAYAESQYIAMNDYGIEDLMFEIIGFCALDGRLQFLRRSWLEKLLEFQNPAGCFGVKRNTLLWRRSDFTNCNSHTTSLAVSVYAAAARFILEEYY